MASGQPFYIAQAYAAMVTGLGPDHPLLIPYLSALAPAWASEPEGQELAHTGIALAEKYYGKGSPEWLEAQETLGVVYAYQNLHFAAIQTSLKLD